MTEEQFLRHTSLMRTSLSFYYRHRFPTEIRGISQNQRTAPLPLARSESGRRRVQERFSLARQISCFIEKYEALQLDALRYKPTTWSSQDQFAKA